MMNIVNGTPYSSKLMSVWAYTVVAVNVTLVIAVLFFLLLLFLFNVVTDVLVLL